jgi:hypothetical protein
LSHRGTQAAEAGAIGRSGPFNEGSADVRSILIFHYILQLINNLNFPGTT